MIRVLAIVLLALLSYTPVCAEELVPVPSKIEKTKPLPEFSFECPIDRGIHKYQAFAFTVPKRKESLEYKLLTRYASRLINSYTRRFIREDFNNYFANSLKPWEAQKTYSSLYRHISLGYFRNQWLITKTYKDLAVLEITEDFHVRNTIDLSHLKRNAYFGWGILQTRFKFRISLGSKRFLNSFTIKTDKRFMFMGLSTVFRLKYRFRMRTNESRVTIGLLLFGE